MKPSLISQFVFFISPLVGVNASPYKRDLKSHDYGEISIAITTEYDHLWDDRGGGARRSIGIWHPKANGNFRPLGSIALPSNREDPNGNRATVLVAMNPDEQQQDPPALKEPDDWTLVWTDKGGKATGSTAIWMPVAPDGYVAVGHSASANGGRDKPPNDYVWCVRQDLAKRGVYNDTTIWDNHGAAGETDTATWEVIPEKLDPDGNDEGDEFFPLYAGNFLFSQNYERPTVPSRLLTLKLPNNFVNFTAEAPRIKAGGVPRKGKIFNKTKQADVILPLTSMFAPNDPKIIQDINDPFYNITKTTSWYVKDVIVNDQDGTRSVSDEVEYGISKDQSLKLGVSAGVTLTAETGFAVAKFSVSLNYQFTAEGTRSYGEYVHEKKTETINIDPRSTVVLFRRHDMIMITRMDGSRIKRKALTAHEPYVARQVDDSVMQMEQVQEEGEDEEADEDEE